MRYAQILSRVIGAPLLLARHKLQTILSVILPRVSGEASLLEVIEENRQPELQAIFDEESNESRDRSKLQVVEGIAVIDIFGTLVQRTSGFDAMSGLLSYDAIRAEFSEALMRGDVDQILMMVDSPGGEVSGVFDLADFIFESRTVKPIVSLANEQACSAAYLLASAADRFFATQSAIVGSIGVVVAHMDETQKNEREGIRITEIFAGDRKVDCSPNHELDDDSRQAIQANVDSFFQLFVSKVAKFRGIRESEVEATEARVYVGAEAERLSLVDDITTAPDLLGELVGASSGTTFTMNEGKIMTKKVDTPETKEPETLPAVAEGTGGEGPDIFPNLDLSMKLENSEDVAKAAVLKERARIVAIQEATLDGFGDLAAQAITGGSTVQEFALEQVKARKANPGRNWLEAARLSSGPETESFAPAMEWGPNTISKAQLENLPANERAKLEWENDPEIRKEFGDDKDGLERYQALVRNEDRINMAGKES